MMGLVVDNFAGGGGASTGIERALGRKIDIAINHDADAVAMHTANHPETKHFCQSIMAIDPRDAVTVDGRVEKVDLAWFSPDCKHHSKAKGGKPREKNIRDLAWVVVHWPERLGANAPDVIFLENVEEFRKWGPLDADGMPIKEREGEEFNLWIRRLKKCGYEVEYRELVASDYGAPTSRKRLYLIARRDGAAIHWPSPTHGKPGSPGVESGALKPWRTAAECIDWTIPCPSIFDRARPLKENTLRRVAAGTMRYVVNAARPFLVPITHSGDQRIYPIDRPLRTVTTTKGGEYAAVDAGIMPLTHHGSPSRGQGTDVPFPTITAANRGELAHVEAVLAPHVTKFRTGSIGSGADVPMPTVTANGEPARPAGSQPLGVVAATMVQTGYGEREGQAPRALDVDKPLGTVVAGGSKHAAVTAFLSQFYTGENRSGGAKGDPSGQLGAVTAGGAHQAVVCAHMEQANGGPRNRNLTGRDIRRPLSTATTTGSQQRVVETTLLEEGDLSPDMMGKANRVAAFLVKYFGTAVGAEVDKPFDTVTTLPRFAVVTVTIDAVTYVIVDIGLRMLTPRELARAMGLPESYILNPEVTKTDKRGRTITRPLTISEQIRMIGNMVCPDVAEALVAANPPLSTARNERAAA